MHPDIESQNAVIISKTGVSGVYSVSIGGAHPFLNVPSIYNNAQYFTGQDVVLAFFDPDSPVIISPGYNAQREAQAEAVTTFTSFPFQNYNRGRSNWAEGSTKAGCPAGTGEVVYTFPAGEEPGLISGGKMYGNKAVYSIASTPMMTKIRDCPTIYADQETWATLPDVEASDLLLDWLVLGVWSGKRYRVKYDIATESYIFKIDDFNSDTTTTETIAKYPSESVTNDVFRFTLLPNPGYVITNDVVQYVQIKNSTTKLIPDDIFCLHMTSRTERVGDDAYNYVGVEWDEIEVNYDVDNPVTISAGATEWVAQILHDFYIGGTGKTNYFFNKYTVWHKDTSTFSVEDSYEASDSVFLLLEMHWIIDTGGLTDVKYEYFNHTICRSSVSVKPWDGTLSQKYSNVYVIGPHMRPLEITASIFEYPYDLPWEDKIDVLSTRGEKYITKIWNAEDNKFDSSTTEEYGYTYIRDGAGAIVCDNDEAMKDFENYYLSGNARYCYFAYPTAKVTGERNPAAGRVSGGEEENKYREICCRNDTYDFVYDNFIDGVLSYWLADENNNYVSDGEITLPFTSDDLQFGYNYENCVITDDDVVYFVYEDHTNAKIGVIGLDLINKSMYYHYQQDVTGDAWPDKQKLFFYGGCMAANFGDFWKIIR